MTPTPARTLEVVAVPGVPEVRTGDDLAALLDDALRSAGVDLRDGDVLVVTSKVVSKAAGLRVDAATRVAAVLAESRRVVAERATPFGVTRIVHSLAGPVLAAAGIDASNVGADAPDTVLLLPRDPDGAAERLRADLAARRSTQGAGARFGVVLSDTAGRPWRSGQVDFALGSAWVRGVDDRRATPDADGRDLTVTARALADEIAAAADLVKGKSDRIAAAVVRGCGAEIDPHAPGARALCRTGATDWFSLGALDAVRAALGAPPGTQAALDVGVPPAAAGDPHDPDQHAGAIERACRLATLPDAVADLIDAPAADPPRHDTARSDTPRPDATGSSPFAAAAGSPPEASDPPGTARRRAPTLIAAPRATTRVRQGGIDVTADDPFVLGVTVARLHAALRAEGIPARVAARHTTRVVIEFTGGPDDAT